MSSAASSVQRVGVMHRDGHRLHQALSRFALPDRDFPTLSTTALRRTRLAPSLRSRDTLPTNSEEQELVVVFEEPVEDDEIQPFLAAKHSLGVSTNDTTEVDTVVPFEERGADDEIQQPLIGKSSSGASTSDILVAQLPVTLTFIHVGEGDHKDVQSEMARCSSAPASLERVQFHERYTAIERAHSSGTCKPCAYFWGKSDSCRRGKACAFCHLCRRGEYHKRKSAKRQAQAQFRDTLREWWPGTNWNGKLLQL